MSEDIFEYDNTRDNCHTIQDVAFLNGEFQVQEYLYVDREFEKVRIDYKNAFEFLKDILGGIAEQFTTFYGDSIVGVWFCKKCSNKYFPREIREKFKYPPFVCSCGEILYYDEEV